MLRKCFLVPVIISSSLTGCSLFNHNSSINSEFNTSPESYKQATISADVEIPKYVADNIERQPLYLIPLIFKIKSENTSDLRVSLIPPTLEGQLK